MIILYRATLHFISSLPLPMIVAPRVYFGTTLFKKYENNWLKLDSLPWKWSRFQVLSSDI